MSDKKRNKSNDLKFNRIRHGKKVHYLKEPNEQILGDEVYKGFIKCKLAHNEYYSLVIPDQIYVQLGEKTYWIQPLYFAGCVIAEFDDRGTCQINIDVTLGLVLRIEFASNELLNKLDDGSLLYACKIRAPKFLYKYVTGPAKIIDSNPYIKLHHHTSADSLQAIVNSGGFLSSNWNIQGTKKSQNISYLYMTVLPEITCIEDLGEIAMSSTGRLYFRLDQNPRNTPDLTLNVYRDSTENRTETLSYWVDATLLSTQPLHRHIDNRGIGYHAIACPFIQRIGVEFETNIKIFGNNLIPVAPKALSYAVVGDASKISGLKAPFDEEETDEVLKIEFIDDRQDIISFWMNNSNTDQYSNKMMESVTYE